MATPMDLLPPNRFAEMEFKPRKLCSFWASSPSTCNKGAACLFAHGLLELDPSCVP
eukprot:NODE_31754_length_390_cov_2.171103.p3 GENE.NODE_31754_length_390_cov_2.171103~~NODE_31754_length_390_cov_2.171103.p3  ORF type:complete len:64 (-),score=16.38 NODE_31754_length_390_cov_2.171103:198-365(-)